MTTTPNLVDIGDTLDNGPWGGYQKLVLLLAAASFAVDGFANQVLGMAIPAMVADWGVKRDVFAPVIALGLVGLAIGTVVGGMLGDRFGRRPTLIGSVLMFGTATALISGCDGIGQLTALRILDGLGLGAAIPSATSLIAEYTPAKKRSLAIAVGMVFIPVGSIMAGVAAARLLPASGWRGLFLVAAGCAYAVGLLLALKLPESPRFLLRDPARHGELRALMARFGVAIDARTNFVPDEHGRQLAVPITLLFGDDIRRDTLALWAAFFCCLLSTYTIQSWAPSVFTAAGVGIGTVGAIMAAFGAGGILGSLAAGALIERVGSRATIYGFAAASVTMAWVLALSPLATESVPVLALSVALLGVSLSGVQSPLYALAAHIYMPRCRATGVGMASAAGRIGAMVSSFTGVLTLNATGPSGFFLFLGLIVLLCIAAVTVIRRHIAAASTPAVAAERGAGIG